MIPPGVPYRDRDQNRRFLQDHLRREEKKVGAPFQALHPGIRPIEDIVDQLVGCSCEVTSHDRHPSPGILRSSVTVPDTFSSENM